MTRLDTLEIIRSIEVAKAYCDVEAVAALRRKDTDEADAYLYAGNFLDAGAIRARRSLDRPQAEPKAKRAGPDAPPLFALMPEPESADSPLVD